MCTEHCNQSTSNLIADDTHNKDVQYKELAGKLNVASDLKRLLIHYVIQETFDLYTAIIESGDWDSPWESELEFAYTVIDTHSEYDFDDDHLNIADVISKYYQTEFVVINKLAESKQHPKSWAYLTKFQ